MTAERMGLPVVVAACEDACCAAVPDAVALSGERRRFLERRVRLLVTVTITYNIVEAVVAIAAGTVAGSRALIGFGLDSVIEVSSAAVVAWQFRAHDPRAREGVALRVIGMSFFALALFVGIESARALISGHDAEHSGVGLVLVGMSLAIMPVLSAVQCRSGNELGSASAVADSKQTLLCTYLSAVVLVGLVLNALFGWGWADPVAGLIIAVIAINEGRAALRGDSCCTRSALVVSGPPPVS